MGIRSSGCSNKSWTGAAAENSSLRYMGSPVHTRKRSASSCHQSAGALLPLREHAAEQPSSATWRSKAASISSRGGAYTKHIRDLTPTDLPALIEAERHRAEEHQKERQRAEFVEVVRSDLEQLQLAAGTD